jgi:glucose/arabinose dehydrogenase
VVSGRLSRLELTGSSLGGEQVLIEDWCQQYPSHSIGALAFGGDGALYVTGGDGASFNFVDYGQDGSPTNPCGDPPVPVGGTQSPPSAQGGALRSQDLRTTLDPTGLNGSVLRVDPTTGAGLPDNPLALSQDANARRIVATGLRNPFRLTTRPGTSQVWVGDVGWGSWEEINRIDNPIDGSVDNFGWPCYEGDGRQGGYDGANLTICEDLYGQPSATQQPHFTYSHGASVVSGDGCATGGSSTAGLAFYPGGEYPASYDGALFFADFSRKCVWVMFEQGGQPTPSTRQLFARNIGPVNLKSGPAGDIFAVDFSAGAIRRYRYPSTNHPPTASAQASPTDGPVPLTVSFDGRGSSDPDPGDTLSYGWDLDGDGAFDDASTPQAQWTYQTPGLVTVRLRVSDQLGETDTASVVITPAEGAPQATIDAPAPTVTWAVGDSIEFRGSATDPQDGPLPASRLGWRLLLQHCTTVDDCHTHPVESWDGTSQGSFVTPDHGYPSHLELELTATDSSGLTDTRTVRLDPRTVDLAFHAQPSGLRLSVGGTEQATPFSRTAIVGSSNSISAPTPQVLGAAQYRFSAWSDGGAQAHDLVAPSSPTTFTATYEADTADTVPPTATDWASGGSGALTIPASAGAAADSTKRLILSVTDSSTTVNVPVPSPGNWGTPLQVRVADSITYVWVREVQTGDGGATLSWTGGAGTLKGTVGVIRGTSGLDQPLAGAAHNTLDRAARSTPTQVPNGPNRLGIGIHTSDASPNPVGSAWAISGSVPAGWVQLHESTTSVTGSGGTRFILPFVQAVTLATATPASAGAAPIGGSGTQESSQVIALFAPLATSGGP